MLINMILMRKSWIFEIIYPRNSEPIWSEFRGLFIEVCSLQCNYGTKGQLALLQQFFVRQEIQ